MRHAENLGEGGARNTGVREMRGRYLAFLDDDDEWVEDKLEKQVARLEALPSVGVVYTGLVEVDASTGQIVGEERALHNGHVRPSLVALGNFVRPSVAMVRKQCLDEAGAFDVTLPGCLDYDMWLRIAERYAFEAIDLPLVHYRIHDARLSTAYTMHIRGRQALLHKYPQDFDVPRRHK